MDTLSLSLKLVSNTRLTEIFFEDKWFEQLHKIILHLSHESCPSSIKEPLIHILFKIVKN